MPRGAAPGERRGGRGKGSLNKATRERLARENIAEQVAAEIGAPGTATALALQKAMAGRKLAKEELEEVVPIIKGIVAHQQRQVTTTGENGQVMIVPKSDLGDLKEWLRLFVETCFKLAEFQSPKFRAIMVAAAPNQDNPSTGKDDNVHQLEDPIAAARVYRRIVSAGTRR